MKLLAVLFFVASATAGRLINSYLPPSNAGSAGGSGAVITAPINPLLNAGLNVLPSGQNTNAGPQIPIVKLNNDNNGEGNYRYEYETANHIAAQESGHLAGEENLEVQGSYSYLAPNGQTISVTYVADGNGFRPAGDHLPTPPPIPEDILKSLEINAAEEARGIFDDGQYRQSATDLGTSYKAATANSQYLPPSSQQSGYKY